MVLVSGDAQIDHPSFAAGLLGRRHFSFAVLESLPNGLLASCIG